MKTVRFAAALFALGHAACGGTKGSSPGDSSMTASGSGGAQASPTSGGGPNQNGTGGAPSGGSTTGGSASGGAPASGCIGSKFLSDLGKNHVLVGASMEDATAALAPFDMRYLYLAGGVADGTGICTNCANACTAGGTSCANSAGGCAWWGCWQFDQDPPGAYLRDFFARAEANGQVPMITYYQLLQASGGAEGPAQIVASSNVALMSRYLADYRFVLQTIGARRVVVHLEPDLWGYAQHANSDATQVPAAVASANPEDCGAFGNHFGGLMGCMVQMARSYAPNAKVGLHASGWATKKDVLTNSDPNLDPVGEAQKLAAFLSAAGADKGDVIVMDLSDRDADYYRLVRGEDRWFDATNQSLPNFHQAFAWAKALAEATSLPGLFWQTPVGNENGTNQSGSYKDNRVDYLFSHLEELKAAHAVGVLFGAGDGEQTTPESDGGNLVRKVTAYKAAGVLRYCE